MTRVHHNPDSWEGWYWGAVHHWGYTLRVGQSETYGTVEDCLQNCDMIVFWAADPETTSGSYGAQEGTVRRQWLKNPKLGIKVVHVDPYYNASAQFLPGKWFAPQADHLGRDGDGDRLRVDQGGPLRQGVRADPHGRLRQVEGLSARRGGRHRRRRPSGRRRRPAFRRRTCARSPASGAGSASISRPAAGATATAAPAATRPASSGRASWCASRPCRGSASPASTWAICNGAARSTSISISPAMPTAACRAIWKTPRCRSSSTSACRSCRP